jgi:ABC-type Mn2+/Zn2+ transport system ATPase subunit
VPQRDTLDPLFPLSALDVVVMGCFGRLGPVRRPGRAETAASMEALNHAGIADLARRPYGALSGGQKQRTLIARALAGQPDMLVLDEPTNGMDLEAEAAVMGLLTHLNREHRMTVLMVSHLLNVFVNSADSIAVVSDSGVRAGAVRDVVAKEALDRLYSCGVDVFQVDGRTVVLPARLAGDAP